MKPKEISKSVLKRLPSYLTYLKSLPADGPANISATALAAALSMGGGSGPEGPGSGFRWRPTQGGVYAGEPDFGH